ncbi:MAG: 2-amino-4-hydroxy-6-hydroxymethyldihydropteridine diphosphokinase [Betaproteobacteria bacterium]|nr:MAG: 2-amino-4-hydroxy-6-hydroxymethyldihydropteridine diphosphokinase [Betaproteobacteria bacterium]
MTLAYVGIGSNLEEPRAQVSRAFDELARLPRTRLASRSSLYRTAPLGHADQPDFINAVAALDTELEAGELLAQLQAIENRHGRRRSFRNAPRPLDLDLLLFGDARIARPELVVPHPRMHQRAFVLQPLLEISPQARIPGIDSAAACLAACASQNIERIG